MLSKSQEATNCRPQLMGLEITLASFDMTDRRPEPSPWIKL